MSTNGIGGHHRSPLAHMRYHSDEWLTPRWLIEALGPFNLDPCTPIKMPWDTATLRYTKEEDGLSHSWQGFVWMNPPYGKQTGRWLERLAEHGNGIALMFARTETVAFQKHVFPHASALHFLAGRLNFVRPDGHEHKAGKTRHNSNAGGPSVLIAYGHPARIRLWRANLPGCFIDLAKITDLRMTKGVCRDRREKAQA